MSPFDPWLATYPAGTVAERPWWTLEVVTGEPVQTSYPPRYVWQTVREDGRVGIRLGYADERSASRWVTAEVVAALDSVDDAHPRPVPPPMCGQVWVLPDGRQEMLTRILPPGEFADQRVPLFVPVAPGSRFNGETWPVSGAVLVAGPFAPWAPKGWRP